MFQLETLHGSCQPNEGQLRGSWVMQSPGWSSQCFPSHPGLHSLLTVPVWGLRVQLVAPGSQRLSGPGDSGTCPVKGTHTWPLPLLLPQEMWPANEAVWSPRGSCPLQEALNGLLPATPEGGCSDVMRGRSGEVKATPKKTVKDRKCPPDADQRIFDCLKTS